MASEKSVTVDVNKCSVHTETPGGKVVLINWHLGQWDSNLSEDASPRKLLQGSLH